MYATVPTFDIQHVCGNEYERLNRDGKCNHDSTLSSLSERLVVPSCAIPAQLCRGGVDFSYNLIHPQVVRCRSSVQRANPSVRCQLVYLTSELVG